MLTYVSAKSKEEIIQLIRSNTRPYSLFDVGGGFYTSWRKENYFELTYPIFSGQASFCGDIIEHGKDTVIKGKFGINHAGKIFFIIDNIFRFQRTYIIGQSTRK